MVGEVRFYDVTNLPKAAVKKIVVTLKIFKYLRGEVRNISLAQHIFTWNVNNIHKIAFQGYLKIE